jgi:hypothetical protein
MSDSANKVTRGGRGVRRLVIALLVLVVLLVVADRGGDYVAERVAADKLKTSQNLATTPDVTIHGVPFLTQFASGKYDHINVTANDVPIGSKSRAAQLSHLDVDLNQVTVSKSFGHIHVNSATANGTIDYHDLSRLLGITVRYAGGDRIKASKKFSVLGKTVNPTITVRPVFANGALAFAKSQINGLGQLGSEASSVLKKLFSTPVPFQGIPFEITVRTVHVDSGGLEIDLVGSDLDYSN